MRYGDYRLVSAGAASGIGAACALEYAKLGARLILTDIDHMDATRRQCLQAGVTDANVGSTHAFKIIYMLTYVHTYMHAYIHACIHTICMHMHTRMNT